MEVDSLRCDIDMTSMRCIFRRYMIPVFMAMASVGLTVITIKEVFYEPKRYN